MKQLTTALGLLLVLGHSSMDRRPLTICFRNRVGERPLECQTAVYTDPFGEPFSIEQCKYYISGIRVTDRDGKEEVLTAAAHLVDQADTVSLTLRLSCGLMRLFRVAAVRLQLYT